MSDSLSTSNNPLWWAAECPHTFEASKPPTGFFLFQEDGGRVVLRHLPNGVDSTEEEWPSRDRRDSLTAGLSTEHALKKPIRQTRRLPAQSGQRYILLKKYEGFVTHRYDDGFSARLSENRGDYPVIDAEFDIEELSETDRKLAVPGAPMVWTIGYTYEGSTRKRESLIYFRRLPAWSDEEVVKARRAAEKLLCGIQWE